MSKKRKQKALFFLLHYFLQFLVRPIRRKKTAIKNFIFRDFSNKDIKILDFGCGEGIFYDDFKNVKRVKYIGVDRDPDCLTFAKSISGMRLCAVGDENICFRNGSFDFIILNCVLHHMNPDGVDILQSEIKRVLSKNGLLIVIELVPRIQQKGSFLKMATYFEEKIKKIKYCDNVFFQRFFDKEFKKVYFERIDNNFSEYVFALNSQKE